MQYPISLPQAKAQLKIPANIADEDADVQMKLDMASGIVLDYLKIKTVPDAWASAAPAPVIAAIMLVLDEMYNQGGSAADPISMGVKSLLVRQRDPALV